MDTLEKMYVFPIVERSNVSSLVFLVFILCLKMSLQSNVEGANVAPTMITSSSLAQESVVTDHDGVTHDTGTLKFSSPGVESLAPPRQRFYQNMPTNTLTDFMVRATEIASFVMSDADTQGILTVIDPWVLFLADPRIADKIANYQLIRGTIQLIFVCAIQGNAFGSYVVTALPNGGTYTTTVNEGLVLNNCMQTDHYVRIDCANAEDGVLQLEWMWPYDFSELPGGPIGSWKVYFTCLAPLQTAMPGGIVSGHVRVFANLLSDYEMVVPHIQGKVVVNDAIRQVAPKLHAKLGVASEIAKGVEDAAKLAENIPVIGSFAQPVEKAAQFARKALSWFGFTRPSQEETISKFITKSTSSLAHYEGIDLSDSASLAVINEISTDPLLVGNVSEDISSFASLFSRWTLIKTIAWSASDVQGTVLGTIPVTPMYGEGTNTTYVPTVAGFIGMNFTFWRGDMEYLVVIPVSKLHRGNLQIAWLPVGSSVTTPITNSTLNTIYDVASGQDKQISVGYARELPFCRAHPITPVITIVPYSTTNGRLVFTVMNPLVTPNPDALAVSVLVFARAKSNMEFAVPVSEVVYTNEAGTELHNFDIQTSVFYQGATGDDDSHAPEIVELVPSSGVYPSDEILFGERVESVRALLQKPSRIYMNDTEATVTGGVAVEFKRPQLGFIQDGGQLTTTGDNNTWQALRVLFCGIACSERYKFITSGPAFICGYAKYENGLSSPSYHDHVNTLAPWSYVGPQLGYEVSIPYYSPKKFLLGRAIYTNAASYTEHWNSLRVQPPIVDTEEVKIVLYHSYGPDIRITGFRQVPTVHFSSYDHHNRPIFFNYTEPP
jgi:hypothetical protein